MLEFWKSLAYTTKFSAIAFITTAAIGLMSMGLLGALLYYPVSFLFSGYPTLNNWSGDWVWPTVIAVGMIWSLGFFFGAVAWYYLSKFISSKALLRVIYAAILWLWAALIWYVMIRGNVEPLL